MAASPLSQFETGPNFGGLTRAAFGIILVGPSPVSQDLSLEVQMAGNIKNVSDQSFESDVLTSGGPVLVDFWAEWCGPCKALTPKLEEIAGEMTGKVTIAKLNVDENPGTPQQFGVRGIPTMILFKNGKQVDQIVGNHPKDKIVELISKHL
jgi:thioredoxin 1